MHILLMAAGTQIEDSPSAGLHRYGVTSTRLPFGDVVFDQLMDADAIILDIGMHGSGTAEVCSALRAASAVPILVLSTSMEVSDRIRALGSGADDYLTKPYDVHELMARITSHCRRRRSGDAVTVGDVVIDLRRHSVTVNRSPAHLTRKEFHLLALLARPAGVVYTRGHIITEVWGRAWAGADNTLDVHVAGLRAKLGRTVIQTARGLGYRLNVGDHEDSAGDRMAVPTPMTSFATSDITMTAR